MSHYCTKCNTNWARLHIESTDDEIYEFCPICKTDSYLIEGTEGETFIAQAFTGKLIKINNNKISENVQD